MPYDPTDIRRAPKYIVVFNVPKRLKMVVSTHHVASMDMLDSLGRTGGTTGIKDVQRVFGIHLLCLTINTGISQQLVEVDIFGTSRFGRAFPVPYDYVFH